MSEQPFHQEATLADWLKLGDQPNGYNFLPDDGKCFRCKEDLVQHYRNTGRYSPTRCIICSHSFVD